MAFCLIKQQADKFKTALKSGQIDPSKLASMDSKQRNEFISQYVGSENAQKVNALFESKLLLKNQQKGMVNWAKQVAGISKAIKMDMISRIERLDAVLDPKEGQQFLEDLASTRLRLNVTQVEAKQISELSNKSLELKKKANENGVFTKESDRLSYGLARVELEDYVNDIKLASKKIFFKEQPLRKIFEGIKDVPGTMKSMVASLDNSLWGRQGIKTLLDVRTSKIWAKNFIKSWGDIATELRGKDAMQLVKADIYSRPNALNGKYTAGRYGLDVLTEEAYPSSFPEKIPIFKRLYKASESAYNGGALRLRADLADRYIAIAEKQGINTLNKEQAQGIGQLVSSMTGRGSWGKADVLSKEANAIFFSVKFLKSNIDTLTAHITDPKATAFTKKEAAKNLLSMTISVTAALTMAKLLNPDDVDEDPRSTNFGKIKIFGHWTDITGGMSGIIRTAARLMPTMRDGKWGFWTKNSSGNWTNLADGKYGQQNALDVFESFFEGKLSPAAGILRDVWKGKNFQGEKVTLKNALQNSFTPIGIQTFKSLTEDPNSSSILGSMILDGLGLSVSTYQFKSNWEDSTSKELTQFKEEVGEKKFRQANDDYNRIYNDWFNTVSQINEFKNLSDDGKSKLISTTKAEIKKQVFSEYGFKYEPPKKTQEQEQEKQVIKRYEYR